MFACLYTPMSAPVSADEAGGSGPALVRLVDVARTCSPRVHVRSEWLVVVDIDGLARLFGGHQAVAEHLWQAAVAGGHREARVAVAATQTAAVLLASSRAGVTVVDAGAEAAALAPLPLHSLEILAPSPQPLAPGLSIVSRWGLRTLGELAALPAVEVSERLGQPGVVWQRWARGEDIEPLVPTPDEEVFEGTFEPEWPIENTEALSYVLDLLLDPLCRRLDRRDRAAAVLHLRLRLVTRETYARHLDLPAPMRDPVVLRTLLMLALEANPAPGGIDIVTLTIDPTPGRVIQESLLARAVPPPEQVATLMARLSALMGERRCGSPACVDSYRPGVFAMRPFTMDSRLPRASPGGESRGIPPVPSEPRGRVEGNPDSRLPRASHVGGESKGIPIRESRTPNPESRIPSPEPRVPVVAVRRFRLPVSARVSIEHGRPSVVRTERQNLQGGVVRACAGPWRTSGEWWQAPASTPTELDRLRGRAGWNRDEWDVALSDGAIYRIFEDRDSGRWFVDGIVD